MFEKNYIVLIVASVVFIALLGFSFTNYFILLNLNKQQIENYFLPLAVENIHLSIQEKLSKPSTISFVMAVSAMTHNNDKKYGEFDISEYLKLIKNQYSNISKSFIVLDREKVYYSNEEIRKNFSQDDEKYDWYFKLKNSNKSYNIVIEKEMTSENKSIIYMNYKIYDKNSNFFGVVGVSIDSLIINNAINELKEKYIFDVYFVDTNGDIVFLADKEKRFNNINNSKFSQYSKLLLQKKNTTFNYKAGKNDFFLKVEYLEDMNIYFFVEAKVSDFNKENRKIFISNIFISLLVTLFITALILIAVKYYKKQIEILATTDALTSIPNRTSFNQYFQYLCALSKRSQTPLSLALFDIDDFKWVNDTHGHLVGDNTIKKIAITASESIRKSDMIARWGGDEFVLLFPHTNIKNAYLVCEKIRLAIFNDISISSLLGGRYISISIGLIEVDIDSTIEKNIKNVDKLLYKSKISGKNITSYQEE